MIRGEVWIGMDPAQVAEEGARRVVAAAREAIRARGRFAVALAGGSTPKALYRRLAAPPHRDAIDWPRVHVFFGDERSVGPDHPDSNYGMARAALLDAVPLDPGRVHRILGERPDADYRCEAALSLVFGAGTPRFDLILLGLGPDGHTASLFPHTAALAEHSRSCVKNHVPGLGVDRYTLTVPVLCSARAVIVLACGDEKASILRTLDSVDEDPADHPVLLVRPESGTLQWLLDRAAHPA